MQTYIKPQIQVENIECENVIALSLKDEVGTNPLSKSRDSEIWIEDVDLWGNESWIRIEE